MMTGLLSGCLRGPDKDADVSGDKKDLATFKVKTISGKSKEDKRAGTWKLPTRKHYDFQVCLVSRATKSQLPIGQEFFVSRPDKTKYKAKTNDQGCLNWSEPVAFNFAADSTYVVLDRTVEGKGIYSGSRKLKIGINPWVEYRGESDQEVVDLNHVSLPDHVKVEAADEVVAALSGFDDPKVQLEIEKSIPISVQKIRDLSAGTMIRVNLSFSPSIAPLNMGQEPVRYNFRTGKFRVFYQLVANYLGKGGKKRLELTPDLEVAVKEIKSDGRVHIQQDIPLKRFVSHGAVQLALKIVPLEAPFQMAVYEGLHDIGNFKGIFGSHSVKQSVGSYTDTKFNYSEFVQGADNFEELKKAYLAKDLKAVEFSDMAIRFVRISPGETNTHRTIEYRVTTQASDMITGSPVRHQQFAVKKSMNGETQMVLSNGNGYIKWTDKISHVFYKRERYFFPHVDITHTISSSESKLHLVLNPWDEGWTFGADRRGNRNLYEQERPTPRPSRFMIDAFRYQTIRFRYEVDQFMNLTVKKAVVMALDPLAQRDTIGKGRAFEPLRDGIYLVKMALVKHFIDPFKNGVSLVKDGPAKDEEPATHSLYSVKDGGDANKGEYYTIIQKLLRVQAGRITTPLEFSMRDLRMMSIRNNIMMQIELIDERKLLKDNVIETKLKGLLAEREKLEGMSEAEKEAHFAKFEAQAIADQKKLNERLKRDIDKLSLERERVSEAYVDRDIVFKNLEERMQDNNAMVEAFAKRKKLMKAPKRELEKYIEKVQSEYVIMDDYLENYWKGWEKEYKEKNYKGAEFHPTSLSYMSAVQNFVDHFKGEEFGGIGAAMGVTYADYDRMLTNDYTVNPASPYVDLNIYAYKGDEAGLTKRTFIGPCTLIANDNMSELRPTDNIDENTGRCERIDCSQNLIFRYGDKELDTLKKENKEFEGSKYHGSLKPYAGIHVDDMIKPYIESEIKYYRTMEARRQVGNFLNIFNLEYTSLENKIPKVFDPKCKFTSKVKKRDEKTGEIVEVEEYRSTLVGDVCVSDMKFKPGEKEVTSTAELLEDFNDVKLGFNIRPDLANGAYDISNFFYLQQVAEKVQEDILPGKIDNVEDHLAYGMKLIGNTVLGEIVNEKYHKLPHIMVNAYYDFIDDFYPNTDGGDVKIPDMTEKDLNRWIHEGNEAMTLVDQIRLCRFMSKRVVRNGVKENVINLMEAKEVETRMNNHCLIEIEFDKFTGLAYNPALSVDRRYIVGETGSYRHINGKNMNINVGTDFGLTKYKVQEAQNIVGANWAAIGGKVGSEVDGLAREGNKKKGKSLLARGAQRVLGGAIDAVLSVIINQSVNASVAGQNLSESTSISSLTFLVMQKAELEIDILRHEKCFTAQFNPIFLANFKRPKDLGLVRGKNVEDEDVGRALMRGLMVCGSETEKPEKVKEDYYYLTQHFTAGDMLDEGNLLNHIWLLALRGKRDFATFMKQIKGRRVSLKTENLEDDEEWALSRLTKSYLKVLPTFPGMYTVLDNRKVNVAK